MNWLEYLGVLEIIQLGIVIIMGLLFWMSGKILRGGKENEKGSRYYFHGLVGPDSGDGSKLAHPAFTKANDEANAACGSSLGMDGYCRCVVGSTDDKLARRRDEHERESDAGTVRDYRGEFEASMSALLADHRLRHGRYDYPPSSPLCGIDKLRERSDADRAATRAGQTCAGRVVDEPYEQDRTVRSILEGTKAGRCLGVVKPHDDRNEE